jgi:hypothetical protein
MKNLLILLIATTTLFGCKDKTTDMAKEVEETVVVEEEETSSNEWIVLFDGSSTDNWRGYLHEGIHPEWTIEDGALAFTPSENNARNIITRDTYTNFVLSLEWKISEGGNSGIFYGVHEDPAISEPYMSGPEIQVLDNERHPDAKVGEGTHTAAALYDLIAPKDVTKPAGEWNLCVIEIDHRSNLGKVSLNGTQLYTYPVHGDEWDAMVADSKFTQWADHFGKYRTGHISLQDHGDKVWFRNIKIKDLGE